jgi:threonine dehydratase
VAEITPELTLARIAAARARIAATLPRTPCRESPTVSERAGASVHLKLESLMPSGSFKERGALNRLLLLSAEERARGVVAASAGNHAQAVARHAQKLGISATVVMPEATPLVKVTAVRNYGAEVVQTGSSYDEASAAAEHLRSERGLTLVHPFDDLEVMAGQGTLGLELLEQLPGLEAVVVPVGGGGLLAGVACAIKATAPHVRVYGVESITFPGMKRAIEHDPQLPLAGGKTIADGIAVREVGRLTRAVVERYADGIELVDEEEIAEAILGLLERDKTVAEGAGAVGVAAALSGRLPIAGKRVAVVVSGGNIDVNLVSRIIERGLVKSGRLSRFVLVLPDVTGALARLLGLISSLGANIVEVEHDRAFAKVELLETRVELVVETRGADHAAEVLERLTAEGYRVGDQDARKSLFR